MASLDPALGTAAIGLAGVGFGVAVNAASQHRSWRRDARLKAYHEMVDAYDHAERCANTCVDAARQFLGNEDDKRVRSRLDDAWATYREALRQLSVRRAALDVIGSEEAREIADTLVSEIERVVVLYQYRHRPFARNTVANLYHDWIDGHRSRMRDRARLLDAVHADLKIHQLGTRVWRRSALKWKRVSRWLRRSRRPRRQERGVSSRP